MGGRKYIHRSKEVSIMSYKSYSLLPFCLWFVSIPVFANDELSPDPSMLHPVTMEGEEVEPFNGDAINRTMHELLVECEYNHICMYSEVLNLSESTQGEENIIWSELAESIGAKLDDYKACQTSEAVATKVVMKQCAKEALENSADEGTPLLTQVGQCARERVAQIAVSEKNVFAFFTVIQPRDWDITKNSYGGDLDMMDKNQQALSRQVYDNKGFDIMAHALLGGDMSYEEYTSSTGYQLNKMCAELFTHPTID